MQRAVATVLGVTAIAVLALAPPSAARVNRLLAPVARCPGQTDAAAGVATQEAAMRCLHTYARRHARRGRLAASARLSDSAGAKAGDVLRCDQFSHVACGRDFLYWFDQLGFGLDGCWSAGEILSRSFEQLGVGLRVGSLAGTDDAHVWVSHFGSHC